MMLRFKSICNKFLNQQNGNALVSTIAVSAIVTSIAFFIVSRTDMKKKYVSEQYLNSLSNIESFNLLKVLTVLAQDKLTQDSSITSSDLTDYLQAQMATHIPNRLELKDFEATINGAVYYSAIPSGPFKGIQAENRKVNFKITLGPKNSNFKTAPLNANNLMSGIPITQFSIFGSDDLMYATGYKATEMSGRIHANNNMCLAGTNNDLKVRGFLTAGGIIYHPKFIYGTGNPWTTNIALAPGYTNADLKEYKSTATTNCTNCDGTGMSWSVYAKTRWAGQLQDFSHGVTRLDVRTIEPPTAQVYNSKFIIEPVRATDNLSKLSKFAYQADIRIVNGVWYLKNPDDITQWPGIPIWSDHPGSFTTWNDDNIEGVANAVGQNDIRDNMNAISSANNWTAGLPPTKYSYYEYDTTNFSIYNNSDGVISYGNLARSTPSGNAMWSPGHYPIESLCQTGETCTAGGCESAVSTSRVIKPVGTAITCFNGTSSTVRTNRQADILNATRGGFRLGVIQTSAYGRSAKSKLWPMNFDLSAFQNALRCDVGDNRGELGCFFGASRFMNRPFNGIVYITNTWNGQNRLQTGLYPQRSPYMQADTETVQTALEGGGTTEFPGSNNDADQANPVSASQPSSTNPLHQILPMQLCSTTYSGQNFAGTFFRVPLCSKYKDHSIFKARTNVLRIINGRTIDASILPRGITIATNLPVFTVGDINSTSTVSSAISTPWSPIFIAGDYSIPLSNGWVDESSRWDVTTDLSLPRDAANTTIYAGISPKFWIYNEKWSGRTLTMYGPSIDFFPDQTHYIFNVSSFSYGNANYYPPNTIMYNEDPHYRILSNQPPGMPYVGVFKVESWLTEEMKNEK